MRLKKFKRFKCKYVKSKQTSEHHREGPENARLFIIQAEAFDSSLGRQEELDIIWFVHLQHFLHAYHLAVNGRVESPLVVELSMVEYHPYLEP